MKSLIQFLAIILLVFLADFLWLGILMKNFYHQELGPLMRQNDNGFAPRLLPAALVYIFIPAGILLFVGPKTVGRPLIEAAGWGAIFGLIVYGIYDLTNLAVLDKWSWRIAVVDILWGMTLCGASAACLQLVGRWFK